MAFNFPPGKTNYKIQLPHYVFPFNEKHKIGLISLNQFFLITFIIIKALLICKNKEKNFLFLCYKLK